MRPATCAPSVVCRRASTTPSAATVTGQSRAATSITGPTALPPGSGAAALVPFARNAANAAASSLVQRRLIASGLATGANVEGQIRRAEAKHARRDQRNAEKAPPPNVALPEDR